uniref:RNA-directed DNA polymerase from mobile element jockey n=1 Tax=Sipha flava TaxID=143950 RepID=A0A2S2PVA2_9HEMI
MLTKLYEITYDYNFVKIIEALLSNRRFFVTLDGKNSRWRNLKNGLPQGSVLAPTLFNIYTNDQPISKIQISNTIYTQMTQQSQYKTTPSRPLRGNYQTHLPKWMNILKQTLYVHFTLRPNSLKTEVCAFHLRKRKLTENFT